MEKYPGLVCFPCAQKATSFSPGVVTCNAARCDICNKFTSVCSPRDYKYPVFDGREKPK